MDGWMIVRNRESTTCSRLAFILALTAALTVASARGGEDQARGNLRYRIDSLTGQVSRSMDGRFIAVGDDRSKSSDLLAWSRLITESFATRTAAPLSFTGRSITVAVLPDLLQVSGHAVWVDPPMLGSLGSSIKQRLWLTSYGHAAGIEAERLLTGLLLASWREEGRWQAVAPPAWLVRGLHRSLLAETRALDIDQTLGRWQRDQLASLPALLTGLESAPLRPGMAAGPVDPLETALVTWLSGQLGERFLPLVRQACRAAVPPRPPLGLPEFIAWFSVRGDGELDALWERWLLGRRRVVLVLGSVTRRQLSDFQAELLLYRGACAIPASEAVGDGVGFDLLVALRQRPWIADFCRIKQGNLRALAAGRGEELLHVTDLYDTFLKALRFSDDEERIRQALEAAAAALKALLAGLPAPPGEGEASAATDAGVIHVVD